MSSELNTQHEKLDRLLEVSSKLDERTQRTNKDVASIEEYLKQLNGKTAKNMTEIALLKQKWAAVAILAPIFITVGVNAAVKVF